MVIALAWWVGSTLLDVTGSVDSVQGSTPPVERARPAAPGAGRLRRPRVPRCRSSTALGVRPARATASRRTTRKVPLAYDGDPSTAWSTLEYRGSPNFGNLKDGVGLLLDLGDRSRCPG